MKKKIVIAISLAMGLFIMLGFGGQSAEATSKNRFSDDQTTVTSVKKANKVLLKGEVTVVTDSETTTKYAKIYVKHNGLKYYDCCSKLISSTPEYDAKGNATGNYLHVYKFCGCKTNK
ncbi:hypothetical protein ACWOC1_12640 [Enterococcus quebecensis]|uniref:Uncharacterized protein n=1 Tax=Enterococcus quebecensis TaxID=903983 RepID=A0A1E5H2L1_9ENTE|nr:hypothetical protein [Enterococcus quebecensis]OEG19268.1 hypothetical protein BCR23_00840 [Enterococcus quebecensis]OJG75819.1 hypothetical protein RV12_GL000158 [Enterococcus quebecensis]